jgi:hypothetical protein
LFGGAQGCSEADTRRRNLILAEIFKAQQGHELEAFLHDGSPIAEIRAGTQAAGQTSSRYVTIHGIEHLRGIER